MKTLLITPPNRKKRIIKEISNQKKLFNFKIMDFNEITKKLFFDYNTNTIYKLMNKYNIKYDVALMYIKELYNIDETYNDAKMKKLIEIKNYLDRENALIYDLNFIEFLKNVEVEIKGFSIFSKQQLKIIKIIKQYTNVEIEEEKVINFKSNIYEFVTKESEITFVCETISKLINEGIDINKIKLANVPDMYFSSMKRIFGYYNIPINIDSKISLYGLDMTCYLLDNLNLDINELLESIQSKYDMSVDLNNKIYNRILSVLNNCNWCSSYLDIKDLLINEFKKATINLNTLKNKIEIISLDEVEDEYVFLMSFNQGVIPTIHKDEKYFNDVALTKLELDTSTDLNKIERINTLINLSKIKNLYITYKLKQDKTDFYLSSLASLMDYELIKPNMDMSSYSNKYNEYLLTKKIDNLVKYGTISFNIDTLYHNYKIPYKKYDNAFKGIDPISFKNYINNKLVLSYSSMDNYFKCGFRYYLNNVLKLSTFDETFYTILGNLFHYCLSKAFNEDFSLEEAYKEYTKDMEFSVKEKFFLNNLLDDLRFIIDTIKEQLKHSNLNNSLYEHEVYINKQGNIKVSFKGYVDKILYNSESEVLAIIDYKTGNPSLNLNNIIYGLDLQLPIYLYLVKNSEFKNYHIAGLYLQKILNKEINRDFKKDYESMKRDNLKLAGYSNSNISILEQFDDTYMNSSVIKSMRYTDKGFGMYAKTLSEDEMDKINALVESKIIECIDNIEKCHFEINPKKIGKENLSCSFCEFKDVCYMQDKDLVELKEYTNLEFLGGDQDA